MPSVVPRPHRMMQCPISMANSPKNFRLWSSRDEMGMDIPVAARLWTIAGKTVTLEKPNGDTVILQISWLCEGDRRFLHDVVGGALRHGSSSGVTSSGGSSRLARERQGNVAKEDVERVRFSYDSGRETLI